MKKTIDLYEHFDNREKIAMFHNITDEHKENIIEHIDAKDWDKLRYFLGAPLPEIDNETCFKAKVNPKRNNESGFKELRNILC